MTLMRKTVFLGLCLTLMAFAACTGKQVSSFDSEGGASAAWSGDEEAMLLLMRTVCAQYATADPLDAPEKGFAMTYYGRFRILAELLPLNPAPTPEQNPEQDDEQLPPPARPVSGDYGLRVTFDKGLGRYEDLVDKIHADLVREFDAAFVRR